MHSAGLNADVMMKHAGEVLVMLQAGRRLVEWYLLHGEVRSDNKISAGHSYRGLGAETDLCGRRLSFKKGVGRITDDPARFLCSGSSPSMRRRGVPRADPQDCVHKMFEQLVSALKGDPLSGISVQWLALKHGAERTDECL